MRKAYISGPMRGLPEFNYPAFHRAAERLRAAGYEVISPAEMDQEDHLCEGNVPEKPGTPACIRLYANRDTQAILSMKAEDGDVIALLPGWRFSEGAVAEVTLGLWVKLSFISAVTGEDMLGVEFAFPKHEGWQRFTREEEAR